MTLFPLGLICKMRSVFHPWLLSSVTCKDWVRTLEQGTGPPVLWVPLDPHAGKQDARHWGGKLPASQGLSTSHRWSQKWAEGTWEKATAASPAMAAAHAGLPSPCPCRPRSGDWASQGCSAPLVGLLYFAHISVHLFIKLSKTSTALSPAPESWLTGVGAETGVSQKAFVSLEGNPGARLM